MADIEWPWQYSFPPFFTIQPNEETRKKQMEAWRSLILKYFKRTNQFVLDLSDVSHSVLFNNSSISRSLNKEDVLILLEFLAKSGNAEAIDKTKSRWYILWHSLDEWANIIYTWARQNALTNTVVTFYEIISTPNEEFTGLPNEVLTKILRRLENQGKAEIIFLEENSGVKFFDS